MGLFDKLKEGLAAQLGGQEQFNSLLEHVTGLINNPAVGGIPGLIEKFKGKGLGDIMASWISTGKNLPISADQIKQVLGSDTVKQIAAKLGISSEDMSKHLAELLPQVIDKLTPNGKLPETGQLGEALNMLKAKFLGS